MKSYQEMIQFAADCVTTGSRDLRYTKWPIWILLGEAYGFSQEKVAMDLNAEVAIRERIAKAEAKMQARVAHEQRRLANLARAAETV